MKDRGIFPSISLVAGAIFAIGLEKRHNMVSLSPDVSPQPLE
jgi:hypothetical protein